MASMTAQIWRNRLELRAPIEADCFTGGVYVIGGVVGNVDLDSDDGSSNVELDYFTDGVYGIGEDLSDSDSEVEVSIERWRERGRGAHCHWWRLPQVSWTARNLCRR